MLLLLFLSRHYVIISNSREYARARKKKKSARSSISTRIVVAVTIIAIIRGKEEKEARKDENIEARMCARASTRSEETSRVGRRTSQSGERKYDGMMVVWRTRSCNEGIVCRDERSFPRRTITGPLCDRTCGLLLGSVTRGIYRVFQNRNECPSNFSQSDSRRPFPRRTSRHLDPAYSYRRYARGIIIRFEAEAKLLRLDIRIPLE
jgi:hypothetical protein